MGFFGRTNVYYRFKLMRGWKLPQISGIDSYFQAKKIFSVHEWCTQWEHSVSSKIVPAGSSGCIYLNEPGTNMMSIAPINSSNISLKKFWGFIKILWMLSRKKKKEKKNKKKDCGMQKPQQFAIHNFRC